MKRQKARDECAKEQKTKSAKADKKGYLTQLSSSLRGSVKQKWGTLLVKLYKGADSLLMCFGLSL